MHATKGQIFRRAHSKTESISSSSAEFASARVRRADEMDSDIKQYCLIVPVFRGTPGTAPVNRRKPLFGEPPERKLFVRIVPSSVSMSGTQPAKIIQPGASSVCTSATSLFPARTEICSIRQLFSLWSAAKPAAAHRRPPLRISSRFCERERHEDPGMRARY